MSATFEMPTPAEIEAAERTLETTRQQGQRLFAAIKQESKYFGQTKPGEVFAVAIRPMGEYVVSGWPGEYRLIDVHLFAEYDGEKVQIS